MAYRSFAIGIASVLAVSAIPAIASSQQPLTAALAVGSMAPDFSLPGATRYGLLQKPVKLRDYRGQTVVLAFFYAARSKG
ncbi:MAG: hypothetical protein ABIR58_08155 [Gemmatimonadaceae bacterium]